MTNPTLGKNLSAVTSHADRSGRNREVERQMVKRKLSTTEDGAHQLLMRIHQALPHIAASFVEAGAAERAIAWVRPFEDGLVNMPAQDFDRASLIEEQVDGDEGTSFEEYRLAPDAEKVKKWSDYKRTAHRYIAKLIEKLRAGDARHGIA